MFFRGTEEAVRKAANKEEAARRYCFAKADEAAGDDFKLWHFIADYLIPERSRIFYDMEAEAAIEDEAEIYTPAKLDESFRRYKVLAKHYHKTVDELIERHVKLDMDAIVKYVRDNYAA